MRSIAALVVLALPGLAMADGADTAIAAGKPKCESRTPRADRRDISCSLTASGTAQRFRVKAHFSGSHDDTTASLTPTLDERPLACEAGSKTSLTGEEEGDVTLECRFSITQPAGAKQVLRVLLSWHHARYTDFEFETE
jgi:hypothetical protein